MDNVTNEQEFWAFMAKLSIEQDRRYDQLEAKIEEMNRRINHLTDSFNENKEFEEILLGNFEESPEKEAKEFFFDSLKENPQIADIKFDILYRNLNGNKDKISDEFDLVLVNGDTLALIEVKTKAHLDLVDKMIEKKIPNLKALFSVFKNYKIYAGIASLVTYPDLIKKVNEKGLFLLTQQGKHLEMINPPLQHW
jgi:hypothetical protein